MPQALISEPAVKDIWLYHGRGVQIDFSYFTLLQDAAERREWSDWSLTADSPSNFFGAVKLTLLRTAKPESKGEEKLEVTVVDAEELLALSQALMVLAQRFVTPASEEVLDTLAPITLAPVSTGRQARTSKRGKSRR